MEEFTPIMTQENFEKAIEERLKKERASLEEKYKGYLSQKDVAAMYEGYLSPEDVKKMYKDYLSPEEAAEKDKKIKSYESASVKTRIAHETGLPYELAAKLSGEDEDSIRKDAESLKKLIGGADRVLPLRSTEPADTNERDAAYKNMLSEMKGE